MPSQSEIFFSYAWGDDKEVGDSREKIVNELYESLLKDGYKVIRDKYDLGYKGYISDFMVRIGQGKNIIIAISEKYVRSPYCMFELLEIARNAGFNKDLFSKRVLPVIVEFIDFTEPSVLRKYLNYWKEKLAEWDNLVKEMSGQLSVEQFQRYDKIKLIQQSFGKLADWLVDMNTLSPNLLAAENFQEIKDAIEEGVEEIKENGPFVISHDLTLPPFLPEVFLGRKEDLKAIRENLFEENNLLLLVNGNGGVGKTSLAAKYYHNHKKDYTHVAWILSEKNIANALLLLAPSLGLQFDERMDSEKRLEILLTYMAALEKPCLLVIDNANEIDDLEEQYLALRRCSNFHILLTTRITDFEYAAAYNIDGLPEDKALELFRQYYPKHLQAEDGLFKQIRTAVGGNTLVVELLAKNLNNLNKLRVKYTLRNLLNDLQKKGLLAISQTSEVKTEYQSRGQMRKESPEVIIGAMYDIAELTDSEIKLLSAFTALPAESIDFEILDTLLKEYSKFETTLNELAQRGWLDYNEANNSFKASPVIQEITKKKSPQLLAACQKLIGALIEKLDYEPGTGHLINTSYQDAFIYARYTETLVGNFNQADNNLAILLERLGTYHSTTGNLNKALAYYKERLAISKKLSKKDPKNIEYQNGLAISYEKLGATQTSLGNLDKALAYFQSEKKIFDECYKTHPDYIDFKNGLAISYSKLGETQEALGNSDEALTYYESYNRLREELYRDFPKNVDFKNGLSVSYCKLGDIQTSLGNQNEALTYYEGYNRLREELYKDFPQNVDFKNGLSVSHSRMGDIQMAFANFDKALSHYDNYIRLREELYKDFPQNIHFKYGLAISYATLGVTFERIKDKNKGKIFYQKARVLLIQLVNSFPAYPEFKKSLDFVNNK